MQFMSVGFTYIHNHRLASRLWDCLC